MLAIALIVLGILTRFLPHAPNFNPAIAIALFGGYYLNKKYALSVPLLLMVISDIFLGLHNTILFTWGSVVLISILGLSQKKNKSILNVAGFSLISAVLFFVITNFGVWFSGWYPYTLKGLTDCFIMGIPFFRATLLSTLVYAAVMFGAYELIARLVKNTRFAAALVSELK
ncbi:MAG TPA: hypothetical protein PLC32_02105 [Candidatus Omnitrophota bacterium]|nr:hypothetical protein [Candidatus Omnitrophota bacterium]